MFTNTKAITEMMVAAANASPINLPNCSGHPVFGSKYGMIDLPLYYTYSVGRLR
jgi:hypothetical protein